MDKGLLVRGLCLLMLSTAHFSPHFDLKKSKMVGRDFLGKKHSVQPNIPSHRLYWHYKNAEDFFGFELIFLKFLTNEPKCINNGAGVIFMSVGK